MVDVKFVFAKMISVGIIVIVGVRHAWPVHVVSVKETVGESEEKIVGEGSGVKVGGGSSGGKVGAKVGAETAFAVGDNVTGGVTKAWSRPALFLLIKINTKMTTIIVSKEMIRKINLE